MKYFRLVASLGALSFSCFAQDTLFQNFGTINEAISINAFNFDNQGAFNVFTIVPYDMLNVRNYTNSGTMSGRVGFQFSTRTSATRRPANSFKNSGTIDARELNNPFGVLGSFLLVSADKIDNQNGVLSVGSSGLLNLTGNELNLSQSALIGGNPFGGNFDNGRFVPTNRYANPNNVIDLFGGVGMQTNRIDNSQQSDLGTASSVVTNLVIDEMGMLMTNIFTNFSTRVFAPPSDVFDPSTGTNAISVRIASGFSQFSAFANTNMNGTNKVIQVVFVKTNFSDPNAFLPEVTFSSNDPGMSQFFNGDNPRADQDKLARFVVIRFGISIFDPITGAQNANNIFFVDSSARQTNIVLLTNAVRNAGFRPSGFQIVNDPSDNSGTNGNTPFTPDLIFDSTNTNASNTVVGTYGAYSAFVSSGSASATSTLDPTNQAPRIEINADALDLSQTRIRSEGPVLIKAKHVEGVPMISAGLVNADLGNTNGLLNVSGVFPQNFQRLQGTISAYTFIFETTETTADATNHVKTQVLIVEPQFQSDVVPVSQSLSLKATNVVIDDSITATGQLKIEAENLVINTNFSASIGAADILSTNFVGIKNLLIGSNGNVQIGNRAYFGFDSSRGYNSITNLGSISAVAPFFKSSNFYNSGNIFGNGILINASNAVFEGGLMISTRDLNIAVVNLLATDSRVDAAKLSLQITNSISDLGENSGNFWLVSDGFNLPQKPLSGDLHGTELHTFARGFHLSRHLWSGEDRGPISAGFNDNVALGRLVLEIESTNAVLQFTGTDSQNALYAGELEIDFADTNILSNTNLVLSDLLKRVVKIDGNMTLYFTNLVSNLDPDVFTNLNADFSSAFPNRVALVDSPVVLREKSLITVAVNGLGIVTPNLNDQLLSVGSTYQMTARPATGQVFGGWTGSTNTGNLVLTFVMQTNFTVQANFISNPFNPAKGLYTGLFFETNGVQNASSGILSFNLAGSGKFSARIFSSKIYSFTGTFDGTGFAHVTVPRTGLDPLLVTLQLDLAAADTVTGSINSSSGMATFSGFRAGAGSYPNPARGRYTFVIGGSTNTAAEPAGNGFATFSVNATGNLVISGVLADGTKFSQQSPISKNGEWPFYVSLYRGAGLILGKLTISTNVPAVSGTNFWIKSAGAGASFSGGFTNATEVIGSRYVAPSRGNRIINVANGELTFMNGNLPISLTNNVMLGSNNRLTVINNDTQTKLSFSLSNGLLTGSFVNPASGRPTQFQGVVLQEEQIARGLFFGTNQSGSVLLKGN